MAKTGRPLANIDKRQFEGMCAIQCTEEEICDILGITDKTLTAWCRRTYNKSFSEVYREKRKVGLMSIRRAMYKKATEGNVTMLIWLSKQYFGMTDKVENTVGGKGEGDNELKIKLDWSRDK